MASSIPPFSPDCLDGRLGRLSPFGMDERQAKGSQSRLRLKLTDGLKKLFGIVEPFGGEVGPGDIAEEIAACPPAPPPRRSARGLRRRSQLFPTTSNRFKP
jgi:hypothetical protein